MKKIGTEAAYYAIVAEYRHVALLEKRGDKPTYWEGTEYFTDGKIYVSWLDENENKGAYAFGNERDVKAFIDIYTDKPEEIESQYRKKLLNYEEVYKYLYMRPHVGKVPTYVFDEVAGVFVQVNVLPDGQHRHQAPI
jgi:hypothetical protein